MSLETDILWREVARLLTDNANLSALLNVARTELDVARLQIEHLRELLDSRQQTLQAVTSRLLKAQGARSE